MEMEEDVGERERWTQRQRELGGEAWAGAEISEGWRPPSAPRTAPVLPPPVPHAAPKPPQPLTSC